MKRSALKNILSTISLLALALLAGAMLLTTSPAVAQEKEPAMPPLLQNLADEGAQLRYLGRHNGFDGWIAIHKGAEQYFYVPPDGKSILSGVLFDMDGKMVTVRQVQELQQKSGDVLKLFAEKAPAETPAASVTQPRLPEFKTPSEQLFDNVSNANWIPLGQPSAPVIYSFIDPQCPHCHSFLKDLAGGYLENGLIQVRAIPIGFREETKAQAAFLLAAPDPQERLFRHISGDEDALPVVTEGVSVQGVERNMAIMQSWKLDVTPLTVYRAADGKVKIIQGRVKDINKLLSDLPKG